MEIYNLGAHGAKKSKEVSKKTPTWIDLINPTDEELMEISKIFDIPTFILYRSKENFRPKLEMFDKFVYLNFKVVEMKEQFKTKQVTFFFSPKFLITIHTGLTEIEGIKQRLLNKEDWFVGKELDYMFYLILDEMIETYFPVLENLDLMVDQLEDQVFKKATQKTLEKIFTTKRYVLQLHKVLRAQREAILGLHKGIPGIKVKNLMYFREAYDHLIQLSDSEEVIREVLTGALESYLSVVSNRMNEVMKVLTVVATIFIPMTFITGVYGMNFRYMPELTLQYGYYGAWAVMLTMGLGMFYYFKKKKWI